MNVVLANSQLACMGDHIAFMRICSGRLVSSGAFLFSMPPGSDPLRGHYQII
jgi:hypothetical protein